MTNRKIYTYISEYFQIALGIFLASIGLKSFLLPNDFLDGGVTGTAILLNSQFDSVDISTLLVLINIPFLILAYFTLSRRILVKSIFSIIGLALFIHFVEFDVATNDKLLISIFGGLFVGAGIGLTVKNGAVLDGSEILGVFLNDRFGLSIGQIILYFNIILFAITAMVLSVEIAMYSILTYIVTAKVIDLFIEGFEDFIGIMIVSKHSKQIKSAIINELGAGMTVYKGDKGYGSSGELQEFNIIHSIINRIDIRKMHRIIDKIDPDAFYIEFDINNIKGGVLRRYLAKNKGKQLPKEILDYNKSNA